MRSHIGSSAEEEVSASPGTDRPDEIIMSAMLTYFGLFVTQNGLSAKGSFSLAQEGLAVLRTSPEARCHRPNISGLGRRRKTSPASRGSHVGLIDMRPLR